MSKSKLYVELFSKEHYLEIDARPESNLVRLGFDRDKEADFIEKHSESGTIMLEGEPLAIIGLVYLYPGVGECWAVCSEKVKEHKREFNEICLSYLREYSLLFEYRTVVARVRLDFEISKRWVESLGFISTGQTVMNPDDTESMVYTWNDK
jgi:hypothetical protein